MKTKKYTSNGRKIKHGVLFFFIVFVSTITLAQEVPIGAGSYNLSVCPGCAPGPAQSTGSWTWKPANPTEKVIPGFSQHLTTNEWWTSFLWDLWDDNKFSSNTWAMPSVVKANEYGLRVFKNRMWTIQNVVSNSTRQTFGFEVWPRQAINVAVTGMKVDTTKVVSYGDWNVKARWKDGVGRQLDATITAGSPYVYFEKTGGDLEVWINNIPTIDNRIGTNIIGITVEGSHFGIFAPAGSTWTNAKVANWDGSGSYTFRSDLNGKNYISVSVLPDNSLATLTKFAQHAFVFIDGTTINWNYNETAATMTSSFNFQTVVKEGTETNIMTTLFPHQWKNSTALTNSIIFDSPRGTLKCMEANSFQTILSHFGVLPQLPLTGKFPDLYSYINSEYAVNDYVRSGDNYTGGGQMAKLADLTEIADFVGHTAARNKFLTELKSEMQNWLTSPTGETGGHYLCYNPAWKTLTPYSAYLGAEMQNDHHFSYGYMLRAAGVIAKFDPVWAQDANWGSMVKHIIRHVAGWDRNDPKFPFLRYHSPYFGHSFAGGHATGNNGNGQESSSEAINFAAAVYIWGLNTHDNTIRDLGLYLYLTEVETAKQYWWNVDGDNFPVGFAGNHIWNLDGHGGGKWTWFGDRPEYGVGINLLPIDAHSLYMAHDTAYNRKQYANFLSDVRDYNNNPALTEETVWEDVIYAYRAMYEPATIISRYESYGPSPYFMSVWNKLEWNAAFSTFNSQPPAHFYQWIHALDSLGLVNPNITADYSSYGVFDKNTCRHYVLYNPPGLPARTVHFSDGRSFLMPEDTTITFKYCPEPLPVNWMEFIAERSGTKAKLSWQTASEQNTDFFIVQRREENGTYTDIGFIKAAGNSSTVSSYVFYDENPLPGNNYYRLKQVDLDGAYNYSVIRNVNFERVADVFLYPNPASNQLNVFFTGNIALQKVSILELTGKSVYEAIQDPNEVVQNLQVDLQSLSAGTYFLTLNTTEGLISKKFVVIK